MSLIVESRTRVDDGQSLRAASNRPAINRVGIVTKPHHIEAAEAASRLVAWLDERGIEAAHVSEGGDESKASVDLLVVFGGDGTMLGAARLRDGCAVPVLGVGYGTFNYLAEFRPEEMCAALEAVLRGDYQVNSRVMVGVEIVRDDRVLVAGCVLNEVVVSRSELAGIAEIEAWWDAQFVASFRADGLIISTPTGSTAYNLSAGGPVIYPTMDAVVLTPICPHTLSYRPLVLPDTAAIEIALKTPDKATVTLDGQIGHALEPGDRVRVGRSHKRLNIVQRAHGDYFETLRGKLRWSR